MSWISFIQILIFMCVPIGLLIIGLYLDRKDRRE